MKIKYSIKGSFNKVFTGTFDSKFYHPLCEKNIFGDYTISCGRSFYYCTQTKARRDMVHTAIQEVINGGTCSPSVGIIHRMGDDSPTESYDSSSSEDPQKNSKTLFNIDDFEDEENSAHSEIQDISHILAKSRSR